MIWFLLYYMITMYISYKCISDDGSGMSDVEVLTLYFLSFIIIPMSFLETIYELRLKKK